MRLLNIILIATIFISSSAAFADEKLQPRSEVNFRYGQERSITMMEFWVPFMQDENAVLYGDLRVMGDSVNNREGNLGIGYRRITELLGSKGIVGTHGWIDRRQTSRGSAFHQVTIGTEWLGEDVDILVNGYVPLSSGRSIDVSNANPQAPALVGTGIVVDTNGRITEEPQGGFDVELGFELGQYFKPIEKYTDSFRIYGGGYYFDGDNTESISGFRTRFTADISSDIQIGARFQRDDERGSQGFLEATIRLPLGQKKKYRKQGLYARLDESPERDIDIVTGETVTDIGNRVQVLNKETGVVQEVLHVDNTAAGGGDGSVETPFNTLAAAELSASEQTIIYVNTGDGTTTGQDVGITLNQTGQQLIGSGVDFIYDEGRFTTPNGISPTAIVITPASAAPIITNGAGDGITVTADNVNVAGITVDGALRDGIVVTADGGGTSAQNVSISNISALNNRFGVYIYGVNNGSVSASLQNSVMSANAQHGVVIYDDTNGTFDADIGGGELGSIGNNVLAGNTLEDLAVDMDGATLSAQNNWWGQASGADTDTPNIGIAPQIYYGAPINNGLVGDWNFDNEWTTNTTAYDRSGQGNNGALLGGLSLADSVAGQNRQALNFDGVDDSVFAGNNATLRPSNFVSTSAWVYIDTSQSWESIVDHAWDNGANEAGYDLYFSSANGVSLRVSTSPDDELINTPSVILPKNEWKYLVGTYDGTNIRLYIDGGLVATQAASGAIDYITEPTGLYIGKFNDSDEDNEFDGRIDNVRVYNRALDASEVSELYRMDTSSTVNTSNFLTALP